MYSRIGSVSYREPIWTLNQCICFNKVFGTPHQHGLHMQPSQQSLAAHSLEMKKDLPYKKESVYLKSGRYYSSGRSFAGRDIQDWIISIRMWSKLVEWSNPQLLKYFWWRKGSEMLNVLGKPGGDSVTDPSKRELLCRWFLWKGSGRTACTSWTS